MLHFAEDPTLRCLPMNLLWHPLSLEPSSPYWTPRLVVCRAVNVPTKLLDALDLHRLAHAKEPLLIHLSTDQVGSPFSSSATGIRLCNKVIVVPANSRYLPGVSYHSAKCQHALTQETLSCTPRVCADRVSAIEAVTRTNTFVPNEPAQKSNRSACCHLLCKYAYSTQLHALAMLQVFCCAQCSCL